MSECRATVPGLHLGPEDDVDLSVVLPTGSQEGAEDRIDREYQFLGVGAHKIDWELCIETQIGISLCDTTHGKRLECAVHAECLR